MVPPGGLLGGVAVAPVGGVGVGAGAMGAPFTLDDMARAIADIKTELAIQDAKASSSSNKKKKKKKKGKKSKKDSSSSSRSRSDSNSSTSESDDDKKVLCWKDKGKNRKVTASMTRFTQAQNFKNRADLMSFAAKHPGALSAMFLQMVHQRVSQGKVTHTRDLRNISTATWAANHSGLSEIRDVKGVLTLCTVLDAINSRDLSTAMDVIAQRVQAIQSAKAKSATWEKAANMELVVSPTEGGTAGPLRRLTQ